MIKYSQELIAFLKKPTLKKDENINFKYRLKSFIYLLIISLLTSICLSPIFAIIQETGLVNMDEHAMDEMMKKVSKPMLFFLVVIAAPFIEEFIFRGPITLFKNSKKFTIVFYSFAILFGFIHITNFTITKNVLLLAPFLVILQIFLGAYFGFIRIRFGLFWSIALHLSLIHI